MLPYSEKNTTKKKSVSLDALFGYFFLKTTMAITMAMRITIVATIM